VLLGHPLVTPDYRLAAVVCTIDAQHFAASRKIHPELDKQAAMADRLVITKRDLADAALVEGFLERDNIVKAEAAFIGESRPQARLGALGPLQHGRPGSLRAFTFRPSAVAWPSWAAWSRLVSERFGARLVRVKGLLRMEDTGEVVLAQGVQGVFHPPQRFRDWPDADRANRLVCIARDIERADLEATLQSLKQESETQS
jgi:G3E family GTPase